MPAKSALFRSVLALAALGSTAACPSWARPPTKACPSFFSTGPWRTELGVLLPYLPPEREEATNYAGGRYRDESGGPSAAGDLQGMLRGQEVIAGMIARRLPETADPILEVGPFMNPLVNPASGREIVYWDKDWPSLERLAALGEGRAHPIFVDLNRAPQEGRVEFLRLNRQILAGRPGFGAIVISQVLNYVDFRETLGLLARFQAPGGLIFVANAVRHGDPMFFHPNRPRRLGEVEERLAELGYEIEERHVAFGFVQTASIVARKR